MFGKKRMLLTINHDNAMWRRFFDYLDKRTKENIKISTFVVQGGSGALCHAERSEASDCSPPIIKYTISLKYLD